MFLDALLHVTWMCNLNFNLNWLFLINNNFDQMSQAGCLPESRRPQVRMFDSFVSPPAFICLDEALWTTSLLCCCPAPLLTSQHWGCSPAHPPPAVPRSAAPSPSVCSPCLGAGEEVRRVSERLSVLASRGPEWWCPAPSPTSPRRLPLTSRWGKPKTKTGSPTARCWPLFPVR